MFNLAAVGPEILLLLGACTILMVDAFQPKSEKNNLAYWLSLSVLLVGSWMTLINFGGKIGPALSGHFFKDTMGDLLKAFIYLAVFASFVYSRDQICRRGLFNGEFFVLGLFAVLGMSVMISAGSFITLYMGLELLSLPLYTMVALDRDSVMAKEAAMKYFVRGAIASGILLYGMSLLYGATGTLNLVEVSDGVQRLVTESIGQNQLLLVFGTVFVVVGVSFKFGALPVHMWMPDNYQNAPTVVTLFLGTVPKLVAFAMMVRLLVGTLDPLVGQWQQMLAILAFLSMAAGGTLSRSDQIAKQFDLEEREEKSNLIFSAK
jgi:NADH-quinone oxidoreductase subunit N